MGANSKIIHRKTGKKIQNRVKAGRIKFCGVDRSYEFCEPVEHTHSIKTIADPDRDGLRRVSIILNGLYVLIIMTRSYLSYREKKGKPSSLGQLARPPARRSPNRLVM